jgi:opacity protein-like surface antigen
MISFSSSIKKVLLAMLFSISATSFSFGQDAPQFEFFGGYSYMYSDMDGEADTSLISVTGDDHLNLNGFNASGTFYFSKYVGITADVAGHYGKADIRTTVTPPGCSPGPCPSNTIIMTPKFSQHSFLIGPQVKARNSKVAPFAHALIGIANQKVSFSPGSFTCQGPDCDDLTFSASENSTTFGNVTVSNQGNHFTYAFGGGLDIKLSNRISLRLIQADYLLTDTKNLRLSAGIVF